MNTHLHILHLAATTFDDRINKIASIRYDNLINELEVQGITDYTIIGGLYDKKNTKKAIHKGHNIIVQLAKDQKFDNVIIAEDDIKFSHPNSYKYFLSQIPKSYDLFCGLIYAGDVKDNRVLNGASGILTLFSVHCRFYDFFLSLDLDTHLDRELGNTAFKHEYYVCDPMIVEQRGGWSYNKNQSLYYHEYLRDKKLYGV